MTTEAETRQRIYEELKTIAKDTTIRFQPTRRIEQILWHDRSKVALDLAQLCERPVLTAIQVVKRRTNVNACEVIGTIYDQPAPSKHRSKRLWKKLRRKSARPLLGQPMILSFNADRLKELLA